MLAVAAGLVLIGSGCSSSQEPSEHGPAATANPITYYPTFPTGTTFTDGVEVFVIHGQRPATIRTVQVLGASAGMKVLGVRVAGPDRQYGAIEILHRFPPADPRLGPLFPADGYIVHPGPLGAELLIGMKITEPGVQRRTGIRVTYTVGSTTYQKTYRAAIVNCSPGTRNPGCNSS